MNDHVVIARGHRGRGPRTRRQAVARAARAVQEREAEFQAPEVEEVDADLLAAVRAYRLRRAA